jgi:type I restriction enzyme R subunit
MEAERTTRSQRIDPRLAAAGWTIAPADSLAAAGGKRLAIKEFATTNGPADYALIDGGQPIGVVEAKKLTLGPQGVLTQAERYARGIDQQPRYQGEFGVPFLYATNGEVLWFHDVRHPLNRSREISSFHTPAGLAQVLARDFDSEIAQLDELPRNEQMRPYQVEACAAVEEAIRMRRRKMLLAMATGTGKTMTTVNLVYRLMKWESRVAFSS